MPAKYYKPQERLTYQKAFDKALELFKASKHYNEVTLFSARFANLRVVLGNQEASDETCLEAIHNYLSDKDPEDKSEKISGNILCQHEICDPTSCRFHCWLYTPGSKDLNFSFEICLIKTLHNYLSEEGWRFWFHLNDIKLSQKQLLKQKQLWVHKNNNKTFNISPESFLANFEGGAVRAETRWSVEKSSRFDAKNKEPYCLYHCTMGPLSEEEISKHIAPKKLETIPENFRDFLKHTLNKVAKDYIDNSYNLPCHGGRVSIIRCSKLSEITKIQHPGNENLELPHMLYELIQDIKNNNSGMRDAQSLGMLLLNKLSENLIIAETLKNIKLTKNEIRKVKIPFSAYFFRKVDIVSKNCLELKKIEKTLQSILDTIEPNFHPEKTFYTRFLEKQKNQTCNPIVKTSIISTCSSFESPNRHRRRF